MDQPHEEFMITYVYEAKAASVQSLHFKPRYLAQEPWL